MPALMLSASNLALSATSESLASNKIARWISRNNVSRTLPVLMSLDLTSAQIDEIASSREARIQIQVAFSEGCVWSEEVYSDAGAIVWNKLEKGGIFLESGWTSCVFCRAGQGGRPKDGRHRRLGLAHSGDVIFAILRTYEYFLLRRTVWFRVYS
jgi:hypothetical protein